MEWQDAPGRLPPGERVYAIGDVHGCADRLRALHRVVLDDLAARPARATLIHLGDLIDKGPDSAGAIEAVLALPAELPVVNLMGNHEDTLLQALAGDRPSVTDFRDFGGREALASWGLDRFSDPPAWREGIPAHHQDFLRRMPLRHAAGRYVFVHAGLRPGIALSDQRRDDLLRIRRDFLESQADFGAVVVHGHTPTRDRLPELRQNRLNLDTGAVYGGALTLAVLENARIGFHQV
ncbi:MAG: serine/threonine protein phosphatase [Acetobacteraceae bacterium]|nr:serine/threonine protein phosphatase [Acetobacteraceae bacterium]